MKNQIKHLIILSLVLAISLSSIYGCPKKKDDPDNPNSPCNIAVRFGEAFLRRKDYVSTLKELLKGKKECPKKPEIHYLLGVTYFSFKKYDEAEKAYKKALELRPNYPDATNNLGNVYLETGRYDDAIKTFVEAYENLLNPNQLQTIVNLGIAYMKKGDFAAAKDWFEKAISSTPNYCPALLNLGHLYSKENRHNEALEAFRTTVQECPGICAGHLNYGVELNLFGKKKEACERFKTASELGKVNAKCGVKARDYINLLRCN